MTNPNLLLHLAHAIIGAPSRLHAAHIFAALCTQDLAAAAHLAEFLAYVVPDTVGLWGGILEEMAKRQTEPPPFTWTDADSSDTAESIDTHLHEGGDYGSAAQ